MRFEEKVKSARQEIDTAAKEAERLGRLSLNHTARQLPAVRGTDKTWYELEIRLEGPDDLRRDVEFVEYELHPTFRPNRVRRTNPPDFSLRLKAWGGFTVQAHVGFMDRTSISLARFLSLTT